eukprot:g4987.t1
MVLLSNDAFLSNLTKLYRSNRTKGKVNVTMKRARPGPDGAERCLVRATAGSGDKKSKYSTTVSTDAGARCASRGRRLHAQSELPERSRNAPSHHSCFPCARPVAQISAKDHVKFQMQFNNVMKAQFDGLKRRGGGGRRRRAKSRSAT